MYNFDDTPERTQSNCVKWNKKALKALCGSDEAEPFWVADMDFYSPSPVIEKAIEIAQSGVYGYPVFDDEEEIFSSWLKRKHNWSVDKSHISYSMGLLHGIAGAVDLFSSPGDGIIVVTPCYRPFREICSLSERRIIELPLSYSSTAFSLDIAKLEEKIKEAKIILFCSPHNPTGIVFKEEELCSILEIAKKNNIIVISDEIHADLVHPGFTHIPMGKANEKIGADEITFMAPSKTFNIAGEHCAFAVFSNKAMLEKWKKRERALFLSTPGYFIGEMTREAYRKSDDYNRELLLYLKKNSDTIDSFFSSRSLGIKKVKGNSSFVTLLDCSEIYPKILEEVTRHKELYLSPEGGTLSRFFGVNASVAMNDGTWFGKEYYSFVRFNYGVSLKRVKEALLRMERAVERLK